MKSDPVYKVIISPIGEFHADFYKDIKQVIHRIFSYKTEVLPLLENIDFAFNSSRKQYHSTPILSELAQKAPPLALKVIAITKMDLFIPILTHVFGEAQLGGKSCIISTCRLHDDYPGELTHPAVHNRIIKEAVHELGHTFKLRHCPDYSCIMHYCRNLRDVDEKSHQLCRHCKILLNDEMVRLKRKKYRGSKNP